MYDDNFIINQHQMIPFEQSPTQKQSFSQRQNNLNKFNHQASDQAKSMRILKNIENAQLSVGGGSLGPTSRELINSATESLVPQIEFQNTKHFYKSNKMHRQNIKSLTPSHQNSEDFRAAAESDSHAKIFAQSKEQDDVIANIQKLAIL